MTCASNKLIFVKIGRMGSVIKQYMVETGTTYSDIFIKANIGALSENNEILVNGSLVTRGILSSFVHDKDIILIRTKPSNQSPQITIRIGRIGEILRKINVKLGSTVCDVMTMNNMIPHFDEEVWSHHDGILEGKLIEDDCPVVNNEILVIEKKKPVTLITKIKEITDHYCEDMGMSLDITIEIEKMLKRDYNIG